LDRQIDHSVWFFTSTIHGSSNSCSVLGLRSNLSATRKDGVDNVF
jgi:hypothetical protein